MYDKLANNQREENQFPFNYEVFKIPSKKSHKFTHLMSEMNT